MPEVPNLPDWEQRRRRRRDIPSSPDSSPLNARLFMAHEDYGDQPAAYPTIKRAKTTSSSLEGGVIKLQNGRPTGSIAIGPKTTRRAIPPPLKR